jgi:hypothetical protein
MLLDEAVQVSVSRICEPLRAVGLREIARAFKRAAANADRSSEETG